MRVLLVQKVAAYRFVSDFKKAFERAGLAAEVVYADQLKTLKSRTVAFNPTFVFTFGLYPRLSSAINGAYPLVHYELDKVMNLRTFEGVKPSPNEFVFGAYKDDESVCRTTFGFEHFFSLPFCPDIQRHGFSSPSYLYDTTFVGSLVSSASSNFGAWKAHWDRSVVGNAAAERDWALIGEAAEGALVEQESASSRNRYVLGDAVRRRAVELGVVLPRFGLSDEKLTNILANEAAHRHRAMWLGSIDDLCVFGPASDSWAAVLPHARYVGVAEQYKESSEVFFRSKINVGIQRIYAQSGLSDRVFNVLFSGGFLLADRSESVSELFEDKKELALFDSVDELNELIRYFLAHETEREAIARRGHEKVTAEHSVDRRVGKIVGTLKRYL